MATGSTGLKVLQTIQDLTIPSMSASSSLPINAQGYSGATSYVTPGAPTTTVASPYAVEIVGAEITSPLDVNGNYEGGLGEITWTRNGGGSLQNILNLPMNGWLNVMPRRQAVYGGPHLKVSFGKSLIQLYQEAGTGMIAAKDLLQNTTIKYTGDLGLLLGGPNAWPGFTGATSGLRVVAYGYKYDLTDLQQIWTKMPVGQNAAIFDTESLDTTGVGQVAVPVNVPALVGLSTFEKLIGGPAQTGVVINPLFNFAANAIATQGTAAFILTQNPNISGGASGNTPDQFQDLGFYYGGTSNIAIIRGVGVQILNRPTASNLQRFGWQFNTTQYPANNGAPGPGQYVTDRNNDIVFGDPGYYVPGGQSNNQLGLYQPLPAPQGDRLVIAGQNVAPFIAANGTAIPANSVVVGLNGLTVLGAA